MLRNYYWQLDPRGQRDRRRALRTYRKKRRRESQPAAFLETKEDWIQIKIIFFLIFILFDLTILSVQNRVRAGVARERVIACTSAGECACASWKARAFWVFFFRKRYYEDVRMDRTRLPPLRRGFRIGAAFHWLARVKVRSACLPNETTAREALRAPTLTRACARPRPHQTLLQTACFWRCATQATV
jgi:hypothetical protein